jgi:hypothetical protein
MIYAIDHKILFYHVPKTGGSSITYWLENNNLGLVASIKPMHAHPNAFITKSFTENWPVNWSFCVVRNPWERWVSWWHYWKYMVKKFDHSFEEYTEKYFTGQYKGLAGGEYGPNIQQIHFSRHVHEVLRYENLEEDFKKVQHKFNVHAPLEKRANISKGKLHYSQYYTTPRLVDLVSEYYKEDIVEFGYTYEV